MNAHAALLLAGLGGALASAGLAAPAAAQSSARLDLGGCAMARGASQKVTKVSDLPTALGAQLQKLTQGIADAGEPFNTLDVNVRDRPNRRLIQAGRTGRYWYVLYERGGRDAGLQGALFSMGVDEANNTQNATPLISLQGASAEKLCNALDSLLAAGVTSAPVW